MKKILILFISFTALMYSLNCSSCGLEIKGQFWKGKGPYGEFVYCDKCYKTQNKCSICKRPAANLIYDGVNYVCASCQATLPKCAGCGAIINGQAWKMPGNEKIFCDKCHSTGDACDVCGCPIPSGQATVLEKKRKICLTCRESSITDSKEAENIYTEVVALMYKKLNMSLKVPVPVKMVSREEMKKVAANNIKEKDRLFGLFVTEKKKGYIYFLFGTPRYITLYALAHEFTHAWQNENAVKNQPDKISEGFAEWAAYKVLIEKDDREAARLIENREDDVYGAGFRYFKKLEEKSGITSVIQHARYYKGKNKINH
jgi:Zn-dependent peptidase ImmA (M78 family)